MVGTYDGRCIFFSTDQLKYHTTIHVRSARGKNSQGRKVTGIEPMPGEDKILITSNDSRIRLYDLRDLSLVCKYRGYTNLSSQIRAGFSPDGKYICAGSENQCVFLWSTLHVPQVLLYTVCHHNIDIQGFIYYYTAGWDETNFGMRPRNCT